MRCGVLLLSELLPEPSEFRNRQRGVLGMPWIQRPDGGWTAAPGLGATLQPRAVLVGLGWPNAGGEIGVQRPRSRDV